VLLAALALALASPQEVPDRPNLVLVLADDLGWTDLGCQGSGYYRTPHLDALAAAGTLFTAGYAAAPNCAPTRAALLSGLAAPRTGVLTVGSAARGRAEHRRLEVPRNRTELDGSFTTLAEVLRGAGYRTAMIGKWHLGRGEETGPGAQGFDFHLAGDHRGHPASHFGPYTGRKGTAPPGLEGAPSGESLTDRLTDEAIAWIREQGEAPFFLYLSHYAVHTPIQAPPEILARWEEVPAAGGHHHATYGAMVEHLDASVGRLLAALQELGHAEDTVVVFTSDNGGLGGYRDAGVDGGAEITHNAPLRGGKGMIEEGGLRVPWIVRWPGVVPAGRVVASPVHTLDLFPTLIGLAGVAAPPHDGVDLGPLWRGEVDALPARNLVWHLPIYLDASAARGTWRCTPSAALRRGRWKLVERFETGAVELYDLEADPGEAHDLAAELPARAAQLHAALLAWRERTGAAMPRAALR
jgi:arylsulfatase A-like enzyme